MMQIHRSARDRCCTPWDWLVRLLFAFLLAASLIPAALAQAGYRLPVGEGERVGLEAGPAIRNSADEGG